MYHKIDIEKLSPNQIGKLLNGHRIRVKHGKGHQIHVTEEQHKKIHKAHRKGCAVNIQLDPFAIHNNHHLRAHRAQLALHPHHAHLMHGHGEGFFDDIRRAFSPVERALAPVARIAKPILKPIAKAILPAVIDRFAPGASAAVAPVVNEAINGLGLRGVRGVRGARRGRALLPAGYGV